MNPEDIPPALRIGVAPAMSANPLGPYWGGDEPKGMNFKQKLLLGCTPELNIPHNIRKTMCNLETTMTAREYVQMFTAPEGYVVIQDPGKCQEMAPDRPNAYTDGSILNPRGLHLSVGGLGVRWPERTADITDIEAAWTQHEARDGGKMLWAVFNDLENSSTRCEIAATIVGMLPPWAVNMGVDNGATVGKGNKVIEHQRKREAAKLKTEDGGLIIGGTTTPLHRESPFKRKKMARHA